MRRGFARSRSVATTAVCVPEPGHRTGRGGWTETRVYYYSGVGPRRLRNSPRHCGCLRARAADGWCYIKAHMTGERQRRMSRVLPMTRARTVARVSLKPRRKDPDLVRLSGWDSCGLLGFVTMVESF